LQGRPDWLDKGVLHLGPLRNELAVSFTHVEISIYVVAQAFFDTGRVFIHKIRPVKTQKNFFKKFFASA
jgi:hypothetical protein